MREYRISRRKVLAGLGGVGIASAGAGLGTTAYFNDEESFDDNELTAGTLDLSARWEVEYAGATDTVTQSSNFEAGVASLCGASADGRAFVDLSDVKPGDRVLVRFDLKLCTNPGFLWLNGVTRENADPLDTQTEPERNDPDDLDGSGPNARGELGDAFLAQVYVLADTGGAYTGSQVVDGSVGSGVSVQQVFPAGGVTLTDAMRAFESGVGVPLYGGDHASSAGARNCFSGAEVTHQAVVELSLPTHHGNEAQTDTFAFDLGFYAEQCRHNDGTGAPTPVPTPTLTADPTTVGATSTHLLEVPVPDDEGGSTLDSLTVSYPAEFDLSGLDTVNFVNVSGGSGSTNVTNTSVSGTAVTFDFDGGATLASDSVVSLSYEEVLNPANPGSYIVDVSVNGTDAGTTTLPIS